MFDLRGPRAPRGLWSRLLKNAEWVLPPFSPPLPITLHLPPCQLPFLPSTPFAPSRRPRPERRESAIEINQSRPLDASGSSLPFPSIPRTPWTGDWKIANQDYKRTCCGFRITGTIFIRPDRPDASGDFYLEIRYTPARGIGWIEARLALMRAAGAV